MFHLNLPLRTLVILGLCQFGRRGLASAPELREQPKKIGEQQQHLTCRCIEVKQVYFA